MLFQLTINNYPRLSHGIRVDEYTARGDHHASGEINLLPGRSTCFRGDQRASASDPGGSTSFQCGRIQVIHVAVLRHNVLLAPSTQLGLLYCSSASLLFGRKYGIYQGTFSSSSPTVKPQALTVLLNGMSLAIRSALWRGRM